MKSSKRKVGGVVVVQPNHNNYGTSLQAFATVKTIQELGYPFRIIRYNKKRTLSEVIRILPGLIRSGALKQFSFGMYQKYFAKTHPKYRKLIDQRTSVVNKFKAKYFDPISDFYIGYNDLHEGSSNYDVVFVGSDQVWGPLSLYAKFFNLLFVKDEIPTFSYASSFGVSNIFEWQKEGTKKYLSKLKMISVRETQGKEIVESLSKNSAQVVLDPTMLLTKSSWQEAISDSKASIDEPYILSYILGPRKDVREEIKELSRKTGLKVVSFRHMDWYEPADNGFGDIPIYDADAFDFINLLSKAQYVCTDSFHCTVFSILFNKKFLTFYRHVPSAKSTHSRIDNLLATYGLQNRLAKEDLYARIIADIDYQPVNERMDLARKESMVFLKAALEVK